MAAGHSGSDDEVFDDVEQVPEDDDDIPVLDASMLDKSVDFEKGMGWAAPVTLVLIFACLVVFGFELATEALTKPGRLLEMGALSAPDVAQGEIWRMLSATFLHASPDHIIGNMMILFVLGLACEHAFGHSQFVFLYVAAALGGSCASLFGGKLSVGASGAIFGLSGALLGLFQRHRHQLHLRDHRIGFVIGVWAVYSIALGFLNPQVDNLAHVGGFGTGYILGLLIPPALLHDRGEFGGRLSVKLMLVLGCALLATMAFFFVPRLSG
jgi:rhomboid protease GluP